MLTHAPGKELVNGESALYLGHFYCIEIIRGKRSHIRFSQCFLIPEALAKSGIEPLRGWYISRTKEKLAPRVKRYAAHLGVDVAQIKIVDERYSWGSCTINNNINLNWRLINAPMFVIDYHHPRTRSPYRSKPHTPLLEHRSLTNRECR